MSSNFDELDCGLDSKLLAYTIYQGTKRVKPMSWYQVEVYMPYISASRAVPGH